MSLRSDTQPGTPVRGVPDEVWKELSSAPTYQLILDYDGTLAPFRVERMEAVPYPGVRELLGVIISLGGRVSLVSGRMASEVAQLLALDPLPEIWGGHGWEHLSEYGSMEYIPLSASQESGLTQAVVQIQSLGFEDRLEAKYGSLALHWRGLPDADSARLHEAGNRIMNAIAGADLALREFDGGLELRALGRDKGTAVKEILQRLPTGSVSAYLGDDQTDEDAFKEVKRSGGLSILVRPEVRSSFAHWWIVPPQELLDLLSRWKLTLENGLNPRTA